jgi:hypothetical protein
MYIEFIRGRFRINHLFFCMAISFLAYSTMAIMPAFNADDIVQAQPLAEDYYTFLSSGRWGYYFVYKVIFDTNPAGPFAFFIGTALLVCSSFLAARVIGLKNRATVSVFILVSTISLYYSSYLSFDSTRVAYPLANVLAVGALCFFLKRRWFFGILAVCFAASLFQASIQVAGAVLIGSALFSVLTNSHQAAQKKLIFGTVGMLIGVILYYLITKTIIPFFVGVPLSGRSEISLTSAVWSNGRLLNIFLGHSIPSGYQMPYFNALMKIGVWIFMGFFVLGITAFTRQRTLIKFIFVALLTISLLVVPFALAFVSVADIGPRGLIAYATVHALFIAIPLELALNYKMLPVSNVFIKLGLGFATAFLFITSVQISSSAFDEYLVYRNDFLATNRIISRIDEVVSKSNIPMSGPIPILVKYDKPVSTAPRGVPSTARDAPWSREWIFRHIDPRFVPAGDQKRELLMMSATDRPAWPHTDSVYVSDGVVMIVIN